MKKKRYIKIIVKLILIMCLVGTFFSCYNIFKWKNNVDDNSKIKEKISNNIEVIENEETKQEEFKIDFENLKLQNSDVVAYLKVNGTKIDYFVVKGNDNEYYLNHNFEKKYNTAGWIYADYHNKFDGTDKNIVFYGHSMKDGSMFGTLKNVLTKDWNENILNRKITLVTLNGTYYYEVFSSYIISPEEYYINTFFTSDEEFLKFLKDLKYRSEFNYETEIDKNDKIITLSSCTDDGKKRVVLHAKLVNI